MRPPPPDTVPELIARADHLAGRPLSAVAADHDVTVPRDLKRDKGWIGELLERALGAHGKSRSEPDFPDLGVELKTLPLDRRGVPLESTWVCTAPVDGTIEPDWERSWVRRKLATVLFVPILGERASPPGARIVGAPLLWRPDTAEEAVLREDWEALTEPLASGALRHVSARNGKALQLRPKAARASETVWVQDEEGTWVRANPKGFYLRASFMRALVARHYALPR